MAMVSMKTKVELCYGSNKATVPESLVMEHGGKQYLKMRPTSATIIALICGKAPKNSSLSSSPALADLIQKRNEKAMEHEDQEEQDVFEPAAKKPKKSVHVSPLGSTVTLEVNGIPVEILWKGSRPSRADLMVLMECDMLKAVFDAVAADCIDCLQSNKRNYSKRAKTKQSDESSEE